MMRKLLTALFCSSLVALSACGGVDPEGAAIGDDDLDRQAQAACSAYLLDTPSYSGPLAPFPVNGMVGQCINLPSASDNRTSSFRLTCATVFFDGPNCTGASYAAATSGVMPAFFDNRTTSLRF